MPELPEVEVTRRGIAPLAGARLTGALVRVPALRYPIPRQELTALTGAELRAVHRRGKYLLLAFDTGHLLLHLGMSGSLRLTTPETPPQKHDHIDLAFGERTLRFHDPRRFGALLWVTGDPAAHPLLAVLGAEPLERSFTPAWLHAALAGRRAPIKPALMDSHRVVGIGNIYASESLFRAGIDPRREAGRVSLARLEKLVPEIKATLREAIRAGGSSLRDFAHSNGELGCFQTRHRVYDREGQPCLTCGTPIRAIRQANRSTYYCPRCQR